MAHKTKSAAPPKPDTNEIATTGAGRDITRGFISGELLLRTQDAILTRRADDLKVYEDLLRDDQVRATFQQRRLAVVSAPFQVVPGGEAAVDKAAAEFLTEQLEHIRFDTVTDKMLHGIFYGYSIGECLWARDGDRVVLDAVKVRKARRFRFDVDRRLRLLTVNAPQGEVMPERKFWVFSTGADNDDEPYGLGLGHWVFWPVIFKRNDMKFWLMFLEKFGMPTTLGTYRPGTSDEEQKKLLAALAAIRTDSALVIPEGMAVELIEASRGGRAEYATLHDRMNAAIAKVILSQTMTTDPGSSRSQAEVHMEVRDEVVESDAGLICESFNRGPALWLTEWNFPGAAPPKVTRIFEEPEDLKARAERDRVLFEMGYRPTPESLEETYGPGYERFDRPASAEATAGQSAFAEHVNDDDAIDELVRQVLEDEGWEPAMTPVVAPIREAVAGAASFEELSERLAAVLGDMNVDALAETLARAAFAARLAGATGASLSDEDVE